MHMEKQTPYIGREKKGRVEVEGGTESYRREFD